MPPWAISSDLKLRIPDFLSDKSVRFSAPKNPLYTKLYSSDKLADELSTQIHAN
ncbi:hypothetical protein BDR04DRAFT_1089778 [Suillus decipiens]|nr:hypothetical protein BDR04DRAFT_1089778 [Suillus decipiens]